MNTRTLTLTAALLTAGAFPATAFYLHAHTNSPEYRDIMDYLAGADGVEEAASLGYANPSFHDGGGDRGPVQPVVLGPSGSLEKAAASRVQGVKPMPGEVRDERGAAVLSDEPAVTRARFSGPQERPGNSTLTTDSDPLAHQDYEDKATIMEIQTFLRDRGHYGGMIDGIAGPGTRGAITAFEGELGWNETGRISTDLLIAVRSRKSAAPSADRPQQIGVPIKLTN